MMSRHKKTKKSAFRQKHPYYAKFSSTAMPEEETPAEWKRLAQDDFARVAKPSPEGDTYTLCDAEGRVGSAKLLRPQGATLGTRAVERYMEPQGDADYKEMRSVHLEKLFDMWNTAIREHAAYEGRCILPQFAPLKKIPKGLCCKLSLKCKNCEFTGQLTKLYTEVSSDGRGAKAAQPNAGLQIGLQETPLGNHGVRRLLGTAQMCPPSRSGMQRFGQKVCTVAAIANEADLKKRRQETRRTNIQRGLSADAPINCSFDGRYNSTVMGSRGKAGQNASQAIALVLENQTGQKQILGAELENKLCWKGSQLHRQGILATCPGGHPGCTATLPPFEPLSERRLGKKLGEQLAADHVPIKYLTTDGDARGAEGMLEGMQKHDDSAELYRKADPIHIGQGQIREVMKTTFSEQMFPGGTKEIQKDQQKEFAKDLKKRCYAIQKQLRNECRGDVNKMKSKMTGIIKTTLDCYGGDCSKCRRNSLVCRGGKTNNWWLRSEHLMAVMSREQQLNMTVADRGVVYEIMNMMLGEAALDLLDQGTDTTRNEAVNRSLSVSLPKNVNFSRAGRNRMHATVHRMNHGPGESCLLKLEAVGCPPAQGSKAARFWARQQQEWVNAREYQRSRTRKQHRVQSCRRQRAEHYVAKAARKTRVYKKFELDPKPQTSKRQRQQRQRLRDLRSQAAEQNKPVRRSRRLQAQNRVADPTGDTATATANDHAYSR